MAGWPALDLCINYKDFIRVLRAKNQEPSPLRAFSIADSSSSSSSDGRTNLRDGVEDVEESSTSMASGLGLGRQLIRRGDHVSD